MGKAALQIKCLACRCKFGPQNSGQRYCSSKCYWDARRARHRAERAAQRRHGRRCPRCKIVKPIHTFHMATKASGKKYPHYCRACARDMQRERRTDAALIAKFHARYASDMIFRARQMLRSTAKRCRRLSVPFDLDENWLASRMKTGRCEVTGLAFKFEVVNRRPSAFSPSIDRIRAGQGYTKKNCRLVLYAVNSALGNWGMETFLPIACALAKHRR